ncbi:MAG: 3'(2'), 5'-bisphosphate nucleotidase [Saprospiraceae bacterium]|jgi:3'(2'), 5'-bisphosphate nucleotidase|uniref:3'(2'),5'-bisphosphate nucleotidase CysQ n=1 Tax=Patiriisocius sp. Uisw_047 TaxID=3230969 RepID=UPI0039E75419
MNYQENLAIILEASLVAGTRIMEVYATDFDVEKKGDDSPLTIADKNANEVINQYLEKTSFPIISEENKQIDYTVRKEWSTCWIVDPVDGTKEFIKRNGEFTVNIALVENGTPIMGVIYVPVSKTLYFTGDNGKQSFKMDDISEGILISEILKNATPISPIKIDDSVVKVVGSRSHLNDDTKAFVSELQKKHEVEIVSKGSSLKFCLVAEGEAHIYPRYAPTMEWDTAAGHAICQAAGVQVIDVTTNEPLKYNKENLLNPYFIVQS